MCESVPRKYPLQGINEGGVVGAIGEPDGVSEGVDVFLGDALCGA